MAVMLTEKAATEVKRVIEDQKMAPGTKLRVEITAGGCSGFSYGLGWTSEVDEMKDSLYEFFGVEVVVDKKSSLYLDGTTIDYHDGIDRRGFAFNNPNAQKSCGCGSSFQA